MKNISYDQNASHNANSATLPPIPEEFKDPCSNPF